jgi:DNA-binding transcriptional ArsR family regulator
MPMNYWFEGIILLSPFYETVAIMNSGFEIHSMRDSAEFLVGVLKSIANTDRLLILCHIAKQELNVSQIEMLTEITQPTLSQQLMMLRKSNVVQTRRDGKQIFYSIKDQSLVKILDQLHTLYCDK